MAPKIIVFDEDARRALERGMDQLANAVKIGRASCRERVSSVV